MKKYITLFSFVALFFIGFQQSQAQETTRAQELEMPEAIAKKQTHALHQTIALTGEQQSATYKILVDLEQNLRGLRENDDIATVQKAKAALYENVKARLKTVLNEEQFQVYLRSLEKPKE